MLVLCAVCADLWEYCSSIACNHHPCLWIVILTFKAVFPSIGYFQELKSVRWHASCTDFEFIIMIWTLKKNKNVISHQMAWWQFQEKVTAALHTNKWLDDVAQSGQSAPTPLLRVEGWFDPGCSQVSRWSQATSTRTIIKKTGVIFKVKGLLLWHD